MKNGGRNSTGTAQRGNDWLNAQSQASDLEWKVMVRSVLEDIAFVFFLASQTETPWRLQEHPNYQRILCSHAQTYFKVTSNIFSNRELQFANDFSRCCARLAWIMYATLVQWDPVGMDPKWGPEMSHPSSEAMWLGRFEVKTVYLVARGVDSDRGAKYFIVWCVWQCMIWIYLYMWNIIYCHTVIIFSYTV